MKPTIVVLEGINGSGKSIQGHLLAKALQEAGISCVVLADPGGTPVGRQLRAILKYPDRDGDLDPVTQTLLFTAARRSLTLALEKRTESVVILDRWWFSTLVYQGAQGVQAEWILDLVQNCSNLELDPELCFLFDVDHEVAWKRGRRVRVQQGTDRFEAKGLEFQRGLRERYLALVPEYLTRIDCQQMSAEDVAADVGRRVKRKL